MDLNAKFFQVRSNAGFSFFPVSFVGLQAGFCTAGNCRDYKEEKDGKTIIYFRVRDRRTSGQNVRPDFGCDFRRIDGEGPDEPGCL